MGRGIAFLIVAASLLMPVVASADQPKNPVDFSRDVRPIFVRACYSCHGAQKQRGSLRLDRKIDAFKGGSLGNDIVPGKSADSLLLRAVSGLERDLVMPPKEKDRLPTEDVAILRAWIEQGAKWPEDGAAVDNPLDWWSLRPLTRPKLPALSEKDAAWIRTPIDAFVIAKLREKGLTPSPEADRRTLLRRLSFDLTGLPPTPQEMAIFLSDNSPDSYERLVERLLASPAYGERWARHWLDVVHYGETHGYDKDKPRLNAWPYRDYVIRTFNDDRPYSRFVQEQLATDVLFPGETHLTPALGFIAAGPWDFIGHAEVPETKIDGKVARHLDRDDMVVNTMQTFNSVTVQCAQCHNHKFDPITQEEYYSLQAVFAAVDRTERRFDNDPTVAKRRVQFEDRRQSLTKRKSEIDARIAARAGAALTELDRKIAALERMKTLTSSAAFGYHSAIEPKQDSVKWVQVDLKQAIALSAIVLHPCHDSFNNIGDGFGFPVRYRIEISDDPEFKKGVTLVANHTSDVPNPGVKEQTSKIDGKTARYIRVTATKLAPRMNDFIFALSELEALDASGRNLALGTTVTALDSIEAPPRWRRDNLVDGYYPGVETARGDLDRLHKDRDELLARETSAEERVTLNALTRDLAENTRDLATLPPQETVYIGGVHNGAGAFRGTGPDGGKPRPIYLLNRGNVTKPGKEVGPGALSAITALRPRFDLPPDHPEGERRAALARWLTDERNPLTWRSIVNRIWYYHFGRGIVETLNDFGRNGQLPTHPELLDWLAVEFREGGQSLKSLHRLIVTSATYRQASVNNTDCAALDANNRYLWHANRRRLEAEAVRDSVLVLSGKMNRTMYGSSYQDFVIDKPEHSPHYEYERHNPEDPTSHRRAIYRFIVRSQQQPFMTTLDCADPSMQVDRRNESLSALQALAMLNNDFMVAMSKHFAERLQKTGKDTRSRVEQAFREALGRPATPEESAALTAYAEKHGLANLCRVLFNLNEFVFVD
jgi:hypothetical protein